MQLLKLGFYFRKALKKACIKKSAKGDNGCLLIDTVDFLNEWKLNEVRNVSTVMFSCLLLIYLDIQHI